MSERDGYSAAKRSLGQNFLVNKGVQEKIIAALCPTPEDWVVELGPGQGAITSPLSERCARVVAVELDRDLAALLPERVPHPEVVEVRHEDGVYVRYDQLRARAGRQLLVVGNLPFNAAVAILRQALEYAQHIERLVLMFQREVALRLAASPNSRHYGLLSVVTQQRARVERLFDVSPGSFRPIPKVAASVLRLRPRSEDLGDLCLRCHDLLVRAAFSQRRKMLRNVLKAQAPWPWVRCEEAFEEQGVSLQQRAENISVIDYARLAMRLCRCGTETV